MSAGDGLTRAQICGDIRIAREQLRCAQQTIDELQAAELALMAAERGVKLGDVVVCRGFAHAGKCGRVEGFNYFLGFGLVLRILRANGSDSVHTANAHRWEAIEK